MWELHEKFKIVIKLLEFHLAFSLLHAAGNKLVPLGREDLVKITRDPFLNMADLFFNTHLVKIMDVFAVNVSNHRCCPLASVPPKVQNALPNWAGWGLSPFPPLTANPAQPAEDDTRYLNTV